MRILRFFLFALALVCIPAFAQEEGEGFLTRKIQDLLSGAGRTVDIVGFQGALSSEASFQRMTIADDEGIWLTLEDVVLSWNRSALLRGRLEVEELSAARIDLPRLPKAEEAALPDPEAERFTFPQLPDLPVSIDVAAVKIAQVNLGAPLVGAPVQLQMSARAQLDGDGLDMAFKAIRTDARRGAFDLTATLTRGDDVLDLLLKLSEQEDGIAATLIDIPGTPSVDMTIAARGPLNDLVTDLQIDTDGQERLAGQVTLITEGDAADPDRRIVADIGGDITAVILPQYRDFFGTSVALRANTLIEAGGAIEVGDLSLQAAAVDLTGRVRISAEKWPAFIDLSGTVASADGTPVLLPGGGGTVTVGRIGLNVKYDVSDADTYAAVFDITDLNTGAGRVTETTLRSTGTLTGAGGGVGRLAGAVTFDAQGVALSDPALAEALGTRIDGTTDISFVSGQPFRITGLDLKGTDYGLRGDVAINGAGAGLETELDARLVASDLSRFSALAGRELDGATALTLKGRVTPLSGAFDLQAEGTAENIRTGITQADALLEGTTNLTMTAIRNENGTFLRGLELSNGALLFTGAAELASANSRVDAEVILRDIATVLPQYEGRVKVTGTAVQDAVGWRVDVVSEGPYDAALTLGGLATGPDAQLDFTARIPQVKPFAAQLDGPLEAEGSLRQTPQGWLLQTDASGPFDAQAGVNGLITPALDIAFDVSLPEVGVLAPQIKGPLKARGRLRQTDTGFQIETDASGPYDATASVTGALTPAVDVRFDLSLPDVRPLVPQARGPLSATGKLRQTDAGFFVETEATGPFGARALVEGLATGPDMSLRFDVSVPDLAPLVPGVSGPFAAQGMLWQTPQGLSIDTDATGPYSARAAVRGVVTGQDAGVDFSLAVPDVGQLVPGINGPLDVTGDAGKTPQGWRVSTDVSGPSGTRAAISGLVGDDGRLDIGINGTAPLGLSAPFIAPRVLNGIAAFDLTVDGPPTLDSLSGTISTSDGMLTVPNARLALEQVAADIRLGNSRATFDITGNATSGGRLAIDGDVGLTGALPADIGIRLDRLGLIDPRLYSTTVSGAIRVAGPLVGGARISGDLAIGETNVTVPSTGLTSIGDIPPITHLGGPANAQLTRSRAGVTGADGTESPVSRGPTGPGFGLDIRVNAPGRIFVRGRGLDAELGGNLLISGTTNAIVSSGRFELARGRLDILGKRFDLVEGSAQFQGDFIPYIRFVSTTSTAAGEVSVIVQGRADAPEVSFASSPAAPQDEVLAQLLFGRNISEISAFQALQLANAVATLAGRGGTGVVGTLRDRFGLDDLDVTTTEEGETALRVGKYVTDNIYTDVTAASDGTGEVSLNIDLTTSIKGRATLESDGNSSVGLFFEKDY